MSLDPQDGTESYNVQPTTNPEHTDEPDTEPDTEQSAEKEDPGAVENPYQRRPHHGDGPLTKRQLGTLMAPLNPDRVQNRSQAGRNLSYLAAYDVKATLIRVFGFGGFDAEVTHSEIVSIDRDPQGNKITVCAMCTVRLHIKQLDATYTETAVSSQTGIQIGEVADFAIKTAESDALKRAATYLGTQFGLSLYANGATADVVRVIVDPVQAATLDEITAERQAASQAANAKIAAHMGPQGERPAWPNNAPYAEQDGEGR